ncbi:hypothetical protein K466DRAFT_265773 [Polyporus arcularius HHB13444]|uniref:Uncharacterized protein n=1 Tax=Polyporus arcularius HHB13444 TaxID=1314778 RepID=A0A5C3PVY4_9APHY|nr:hypothetical protein K466DRAFT_265773 [Polyporus arcularius HHB13444]
MVSGAFAKAVPSPHIFYSHVIMDDGGWYSICRHTSCPPRALCRLGEGFRYKIAFVIPVLYCRRRAAAHRIPHWNSVVSYPAYVLVVECDLIPYIVWVRAQNSEASLAILRQANMDSVPNLHDGRIEARGCAHCCLVPSAFKSTSERPHAVGN